MNNLLNKLEAEEAETQHKLFNLIGGPSENIREEIQLRTQLSIVQRHIRWVKKELRGL